MGPLLGRVASNGSKIFKKKEITYQMNWKIGVSDWKSQIAIPNRVAVTIYHVSLHFLPYFSCKKRKEESKQKMHAFPVQE